jgi:hypothetical protein
MTKKVKARMPDFEGTVYDARGSVGSNNLLGTLKLWWKLRSQRMNDPYLSSTQPFRFRCYCGKETPLRLTLYPKSAGSMPGAQVFAAILGVPEEAESDPFSDQDARDGGAL